nr:trehalase-like [Onthophagus taurus]
MARYVSESRGPRPEMYNEDYKLVENEDEDIQQDIFNDIKAADESGWGLSSRWMVENLSTSNNSQIYDINFIRASSISPVDLNSFLYGAFLRLSSMYLILEDLEKRSYWYELARDMKKTIQLVLWDEKDGIWYDYNLDSQRPIKKYSASNLTPLWVEAYNDSLCLKAKQAFRAASYLVRLGINKFEGGIPATLENTGEKWDFPNAFAPIQSMIVQGLARSGSEAAAFLAEQFARDWIKANMISWKQRGVLFDYYDSERPGKTNQGVDKKFGGVNGGWSSGVLLEFINTYYVMMNKNSSFMIVT